MVGGISFFDLKKNGDGRAATPFYLEGKGIVWDGHLSFVSKVEGEWDGHLYFISKGEGEL